MSERLLDALFRLRLHPDVEVDSLAVDDGLTVADLRFGDDPIIQHRVPLERNVNRELNLHASVREVEARVVSASDHGSLPRVRRRWAGASLTRRAHKCPRGGKYSRSS